ncbi:MAG: recombinase family protein [Defluviitaleaceae bacterium]|nr:recombinase family protein [Defluviitaleaceae bacterium]
MNKTEGKITALYQRLSSDDGTPDESNSIQNQKILLEQYAHANGLTNIRHYADDGISGLRFDDRPGYVRMMDDIENGFVAVCIIKDMSRLGRDHIRVGLSMETMRINGVRLIAVTDGVDTSKGDDDFMPFRNIMHEFYAKDSSKKVKAAYRAKGMSGKPIASVPLYGYKKHPDNKDFWIIDDEAAAVVRRIFGMVMEGHGLYHICYTLSSEKVLAPGYYQASKGTGKWLNRKLPDPYTWNMVTVDRMLKKREYCGDIVNFKTTKHYKDKHSKWNDENDWVVYENAFEPIIDHVTFENVQRIYKATKKVRADKNGQHHPLAGLLFCSSCGNKMYIFREGNKGRYEGKPYAQCGHYRGSYDKISHHYAPLCKISRRITVESLMEVVRNTIKAVADYAKSDKEGFEKMLRELLIKEQTGEVKAKQKRLIICEKRHAELNTLLNRIYEDNALGRLDAERYE